MFPKKQRLNRRSFEEILKKGKILHSDCNYFYSRYVLDKNKPTKFSIVVPKKIEKKAILRHQTKRIISKLLKEIEEKGSFPAGSYIFFSKNKIKEISPDILREDLLGMIKKIS